MMMNCILHSELRQMRQKQDQEKRDLVESQRTMGSIEAAAKRQYAADQKAAEEAQKQRLGEWVSMQANGDWADSAMHCPYTSCSLLSA